MEVATRLSTVVATSCAAAHAEASAHVAAMSIRTMRHPFSVAERRIDLVELCQQRGPFEDAEGPARLRKVQVIRGVDDGLRRHPQLDVAGERRYLHLARALQLEDVVERLRNARA